MNNVADYFAEYKCTGNIQGETGSQKALGNESDSGTATHLEEKADVKR